MTRAAMATEQIPSGSLFQTSNSGLGLADLAATASCNVQRDLPCSHCGLPVPPDVAAAAPMQVGGLTARFCCHGCETVFLTLHEHGLGQYYAVASAGGAKASRGTTTGRSYTELDDAGFQAAHVRAMPGGLLRTDLYLESVHCAACVWLVERIGQAVPGVVDARLDLHRQMAELTWDPQQAQLSAIARALDAVGYPPHPIRGAAAQAMRRQEERALLGRIGLAWAVAGNVMVMSLALYAGWFEDMDLPTTELFRWVSFLLTIPSLFWSGQVFFKGAWAALQHRYLHMDLPIAIGLGAGFVGGAVNTIRGTGEVYFDSVASLIFLLLVGRWLQARQRRLASDAAELLYSLAPARARLVAATGEVADVPVERVQVGDLLEVRAGDTIPADGMVVSGASNLDLAVLTGESRPVPVQPGDKVHAGSVSLSGLLRLRAEATGESSRVGQLCKAVEEAARRRAPLVALADKVVGRFVGVILALAAVTAVVWAFLDPAMALDHTVALLIVTCPCALGLATPLAVHAALGRAAQRGILVKGGDALEKLAKPARVLFDKTGTLTAGRMQVTEFVGDVALAPELVALERHSAHPLALAVLQFWPDVPAVAVSEVEQVQGSGLQGQVAGRVLTIGTPRWIRSQGVVVGPAIQQWLDRVTAAAQTPVLVATGGQVVAQLAFGDPIRPDAASAIAQLRRLGCQVGILSGDDPAVVAAVAKQLGLYAEDCEGGATPERKLAVVEAAAKAGPVVMVGDGVNDAAALAAATVGVSVHGGAEASLQAADVFLTSPGVSAVVELLVGARRTVHVIKRNILFSLLYNAVGIVLAMLGLLSPLIAAILMPISSLTVVSSSFRSRTFAGTRLNVVAPESAWAPLRTPADRRVLPA
jgi:Cu2+-exporting ATPase